MNTLKYILQLIDWHCV